MAGYDYPRSIEQMRNEVSKAYNGQKWKDKVRNMSDAQVTAIYYKMNGTGQVKKNTYDPYKNFKTFA